MTAFHLTTESKYAVRCEGCPQGTGFWPTPEAAEQEAGRLGFSSQITDEDGALNFCRECSRCVVEQSK